MRKGRTGCITCRIRKIKCDEAKPSCQKCLSTGRTCDGYSTLPFSGRDLGAASRGPPDTSMTAGNPSVYETRLVARLLSNSSFRSVTDKRYFQFFRCCTVVGTNLSVNSRFWDRLVLQACDAEPAIKHAVLSLAALHSSVVQQDMRDVVQQHLHYAARQYHIALGEASTLLENASTQQIDRILIVCMLFILYEGMRGNFAASRAHMLSGRAIVAQSRQARPKTSRRINTNEIIETFARLDVFAISLSEGVAPYHYTLNDILRMRPVSCLLRLSNIDQARSSLIDLLRWILVLGNYIHFHRKNSGYVLAHFEALWQDSGQRLSTWRRQWDELLSTVQEPVHDLRVKMIELWYTTAAIIIASGLTHSQAIYDSLSHQFARIVELSEHLSSEFRKLSNLASFSLDLGFLMSNFFCALRCRDPQLRRRAIRVLELCPRREGVWESTAAAAIATRCMQIEEKGLEDVQLAGQVPESDRVATVEPQVDLDHSLAKVRFTFSTAGGQERVWIDETISWIS